MLLGASWPLALPARHSFLRQPSSYLVIRAPGWKKKAKGPESKPQEKLCPGLAPWADFRHWGLFFFL